MVCVLFIPWVLVWSWFFLKGTPRFLLTDRGVIPATVVRFQGRRWMDGWHLFLNLVSAEKHILLSCQQVISLRRSLSMRRCGKKILQVKQPNIHCVLFINQWIFLLFLCLWMFQQTPSCCLVGLWWRLFPVCSSFSVFDFRVCHLWTFFSLKQKQGKSKNLAMMKDTWSVFLIYFFYVYSSLESECVMIIYFPPEA